MKMVFIHDEKLQKKNRKYYTTGGLGNSINTKYLKYFDEITLVLRSELIKDQANTKLREINNEKVRVIEVDDFKTIDLKKMKKIENKIEEEVEKADKVVIKLPSNNGEIGIKYARKLNKPYAIELVGCPLDALKNHGSLIGKILAPIKYRKIKKIVKEAENVLYVTEKFLQDRYPSDGENIVGCSDVEINKVKFKEKETVKDLKDKEIKIGMIGTLTTKYKGHETAFRAIAKLKEEFDLKLYLVGYGTLDVWKSLIKELGIENNVIFEGVKESGKEVFEWLDNIDIYIQPSLTEGMPRAVMEAMSRGCPVIATKVGGIPEIIDEKYLIEKNDVNELVIKMRKIIIDEEEYRKISTKNSIKSEEFLVDKLERKRRKFYMNIGRV